MSSIRDNALQSYPSELNDPLDSNAASGVPQASDDPSVVSTTEVSGTDNSLAFFRGVVQSVVYRSEESGFGIVKVQADAGMQDSQSPLGGFSTVVGIISDSLASGSCIIARGQWQTHAKFGRQFRAKSLTETDPLGANAIRRYLSSGTVKGFGPKLADRVVEKFGDDTLSIIDDTPNRLLEVTGIGPKKLDEILSSWRQKKNLREVMLFFQGHNISMSLAQRIYNAYGDSAIETVKNNPYTLAREVWGIGFLTADRVAEALGVSRTSPERLTAGLAHVLKVSCDEGHCYLPREKLLEDSLVLLQVDNQELLAQPLVEACLRGDVVDVDGHIYLPPLYTAEQQLARSIAARAANSATPAKAISAQLIEQSCNRPQLPAGNSGTNSAVINLSSQQQEAIRLAAQRSLVVITGGPGCGKTTVLRTISGLFQRAGLEVKLAAPTGRAAQRLSEVCGLPASTIHRLLKFDPVTRGFIHDEDDRLELDALIVDESSMIDLVLAASLMKALPAGARVIIVGDADQLPSVGPGLFLSDILDIPQVPRVQLTTLFRRGDQSAITEIAHQINQGTVPHIPQPDGSTKTDAYFLPVPDAEAAANMIERLVVEQIPKKFGISGSDITVLTPMNQGKLGIIALNHQLQQRIVPQIPGIPFVKIGNLEFRIGDRVCQRVNNYNIHSNGVFNGDQGVIEGIDSEQKTLHVKLWDGREIEYPKDSLTQLDLAYALTIHRSQGSEVPAVVLIVHDSHLIMLERQLIYTAVTRAKKLLIVVGTKKALALAVKRSKSKRRFSALTPRILELISGID